MCFSDLQEKRPELDCVIVEEVQQRRSPIAAKKLKRELRLKFREGRQPTCGQGGEREEVEMNIICFIVCERPQFFFSQVTLEKLNRAQILRRTTPFLWSPHIPSLG